VRRFPIFDVRLPIGCAIWALSVASRAKIQEWPAKRNLNTEVTEASQRPQRTKPDMLCVFSVISANSVFSVCFLFSGAYPRLTMRSEILPTLRLPRTRMQNRVVCAILGMSLSCVIAPGAEMPGHQPTQATTTEAATPFHWPNGKRAAVSLSFDDARLSQIDVGLALLNEHHMKATFFLQAANIHNRLEGWKKAVADGHEIGSHTVTHPCTGNYAFSRHNALEDYTLQMMEDQLDDADAQIQQMLGVKPRTFAYPCGLKFVGRGVDARSYVPLIAQHFIAGRGYLDESPNDPTICDLAQAMGTPFDDMDLEHMKAIVDEAAKQGRWVIFVGHDIGTRGYQVTDATALGALCDYLKDPANGVWLGTVEEVAQYIRQRRHATAGGDM
jgi:peptidoglycan-N-acetylglucosamine deacetylase